LLGGLPLRSARRVLDLGAGVGTLLPPSGRTAAIVTDRAEGMLRQAPATYPASSRTQQRFRSPPTHTTSW
jgi:hypothetical protein